jgi:uncharacterized protein YegL
MIQRLKQAGVCISFLAGVIGSQGAAQDAVYPDNVVIVLDTSGSMDGQMKGVKKMDAAKGALKEVLRQVPETTHIGLLVFGARGGEEDWIYPLGPRDEEKLAQAIDLPTPGGGTPLGFYMKRGADRLLEQRQKQFGYGTYKLLVVTDGEAQDQDLVDRFAPEIMARGITLDAIGVDMRQDHTLARAAHSYRRADDPESLKEAIADVFAEVSDSGDGSATEEAFALLAPLPDELAGAMLKALATSGNQPVGEGPHSGVSSPQQVSPIQPQSSNVPGQAPSGSSSNGGISKIWLFVIACVVVYFLSAGKKARKRRRH